MDAESRVRGSSIESHHSTAAVDHGDLPLWNDTFAFMDIDAPADAHSDLYGWPGEAKTLPFSVDLNNGPAVEAETGVDLRALNLCWTCNFIICQCNSSSCLEASTLPSTIDDILHAPERPNWPEESYCVDGNALNPLFFHDREVPIVNAAVLSTQYPHYEQTGPVEPQSSVHPPDVESNSPPRPKATRKRAKIKDAALAELDKQFGIDAYPKAAEMSLLVKATNFTAKEIRTWFSNARSRRKQDRCPKSDEQTYDQGPASGITNTNALGHNSTVSLGTYWRDSAVSERNIKILDRKSPTSSVTSLERYMAQPLSEELSPQVEAKLRNCSPLHQIIRDSVSQLGTPHPLPPLHDGPRMQRAYSRTGSMNSFGSARSRHSHGSMHSAGSQWSHRGKQQCTCTHGFIANRSGSAESKGSPEFEQEDQVNRLLAMMRKQQREIMEANDKDSTSMLLPDVHSTSTNTLGSSHAGSRCPEPRSPSYKLPNYMAPMTQAHSRAGSVRSFGSARSQFSFGSVHSADSRGSRRGRKTWKRTNSYYASNPESPDQSSDSERTWTTLLKEAKAENESLKSIIRQKERLLREVQQAPTTPPDNLPTSSEQDSVACHLNTPGIFCTWPDCNGTFKHRYDWIRHEGPLHYQPYRWLCCSEYGVPSLLPRCYICGEENITTVHIIQQHFSTCLGKPESDRDFWRKDHLADHIKRVHCTVKTDGRSVLSPKGPVPADLLEAWKLNNDAMPQQHLLCGFCGYTSSDWEDRNAHVFAHFGDGMTKSQWTPGPL